MKMETGQGNTIWELKSYDRTRARELQKELNCQPLTAALLVQRGIVNAEEAKAFLNPDLGSLVDPMLISGMAAAVARIREAAARQEKVVIYGDYDVDGICSIVILKQCLADMGLEADYYIPDRFTEGYGLNPQALEELVGKGFRLMITVDCGITAVEEAEYARQHNLDIIITDHHTPQETIPRALALINTKLDSIEAVRDLSGAATAFKLAQALGQGCLSPGRLKEWLDLVALATVADIVPLKGENRILVKHGLEQMQQTVHLGIRCLLEELELVNTRLESWHVAFLIAPKLNSAGRLDTARRSVELLLTGNPLEARSIARQLCEMNSERRQIEETILGEAIAIIEQERELNEDCVLVVAREGWHQGVVGIVASRLVERFNRPALVISWEGERGRGSARSIGDFDMHTALGSCREHLVSFGGHRMAAGLQIEKERLYAFRKAINQYAASLEGVFPLARKYVIDMELSGSDLGTAALADIQRLKPFGEGNPGPQFMIKGASISEAALVGRGREHLRFRLEPGSHPSIAFNLAARMELPHQICKQDFLFRLEENNYNGSSLQLKMRDIKCSFRPDNPLVKSQKPGQARILELFQETVRALGSKQQVIYVYPALRALQKHKDVVNHYFRENQQLELHGGLDEEKRRIAEGTMSRRAPRLFLTTSAYWEGRLKDFLDADSPPLVVYWWPLAQPDNHRVWRQMVVPASRASMQWKTLPPEAVHDYRKVLCYANRSATLNRLSLSGLPVFKEAGIKKALSRREARRDFDNNLRGWLLTDGSQTPGHEYPGAAEAIYLADCPFGLYEIDALLPDELEPGSITIHRAYGLKDIEANRRFLQKLYPDEELLAGCWEYLMSQPGNYLEKNVSVWLQEFGHKAGKAIKKWELQPIMQVLEERSLLKCHIKGNIITIIVEDRQGAVYTDASTALLEEGQAESACLQHWLDTAQFMD